MKFTSKYLIVLAVLTVVILGSQLLMQTTIANSTSDARIINISGRQRMLSQKITKASLNLFHSESKEEFTQAKTELTKATQLWQKSHHNLRYGSSDMDTREINKTQELTSLFSQIEPYFQHIRTSTDQLSRITYDALQTADHRASLEGAVKKITSNEATFLKLMNQITFQYDAILSGKIRSLSNNEYYLMGLTFLLILLEVFFIFRPMLSASKKNEELITHLDTELSDTKSYTSSQIREANDKIIKLKKIARQLQEKLAAKEKEYTLTTTDRMNKIMELQAEKKNYIKEIQTLKQQLLV